MKVALFIEKYDPARGGRERSTAEIARLLSAAGCEVTVVCKRGGGEIAGEPFKVVVAGAVPLGRLAEAISFDRRCGVLLRSGRFDITHAMFPLPGVDVYQLRNGIVPAVWAANRRAGGGWGGLSWWANPARLYHWRQEWRIVRDPRTLLLPVSQRVARDVQHYYGRSAGVRTIFNGITPPADFADRRAAWREELRRRHGVADDEVLLLCPAMNPQLKGVDHLLAALRRLRKTGAPAAERLRLLVVGGGVGAVKDPAVTALPRQDEIFPLYAAADAVALLSWYDACSRVVLEACAAGVPCITTAGNGAAEILEGQAGLVIDSPAHEAQLDNALATMADDARRAAMAEAAAARAPRTFMRRHVDELLDVYRELLAKRS